MAVRKSELERVLDMCHEAMSRMEFTIGVLNEVKNELAALVARDAAGPLVEQLQEAARRAGQN